MDVEPGRGAQRECSMHTPALETSWIFVANQFLFNDVQTVSLHRLKLNFICPTVFCGPGNPHAHHGFIVSFSIYRQKSRQSCGRQWVGGWVVPWQILSANETFYQAFQLKRFWNLTRHSRKC